MSDNVIESPKTERKENALLNFITGTSLNRIGRAKFITRTMIFGLIVSACSFIVGIFQGLLEGTNFGRLSYILLIGLMCFSLYGTIYLNNKRFHDRGQSGWWQLLQFIPIVNLIVIIYLWVAPGNKGANKYGEASETKTREKVLAWILPILIIIIIVGIFAAALLPRLQAAQNRARDVARHTHLSQIQAAIVASQMDNGERPGMNSAKNGISVSNIESSLKETGLTSLPVDPLLGNKNSGLGNAMSDGEYLYLVAKRNSVDNGAFVLMSKTETEGGSNWVVCDKNVGQITTNTDLADIQLCNTVSAGNTCSNSNGICTYTSMDQLRYVLIY